MKQWILKPGQETFEVVDGKLAGRKFEPGKVYTEIPEPEQSRFEVVAPPQSEPQKSRKGQEHKK